MTSTDSQDAVALQTIGIAKSFSGTKVLRDVNLSVGEGRIHALIGPNGAGKSTLFKIISGEIPPTDGTVHLRGEDITGISPAKLVRQGVGRNFQVARVFNGLTVAQNLTISIEAADRWGRGWQKQDRLWVQAPKAWTREMIVEQLEILGIPQLIDRPVAELAHGDRKLVELALTLVQEPKMLLLDEPMAGMSPDEVHRCAEVLERLHEQKDLTIVLVEHDMETVFRLASTISVLAGGVLIASGPPDEVRSDEAVREAYLGKAS